MPFFKNKIFLRVICCFLAMLCFVSVFTTVIKNLSEKSLEVAALENLNIEFQNGAKSVQRVFSQIRYAMSELSVDLAASDAFSDGTYINENDVRADMRSVFVDRRQNEFSSFIASVFVFDLSKPGYIYELTETLPTEAFFDQYLVSDVYTREFWASRVLDSEAFEIFPADVFSEAKETKRVEMALLPVAYMPQDDCEYIMVMLLDVVALAEKYGFSAMYTGEGKVICSVNDELISREELFSGKTKKILKFQDEQNGGIYIVKSIAKTDISTAKRSFGATFNLVLFAFFLVFLAILCFLTVKAYLLTKSIFGKLNENSEVRAKYKNGVSSLEELKDAVKMIASHDVCNTKNIKTKESVLDSLLLQSQMRDVYVEADDIEKKVTTKTESFYMVFCHVNYKEDFCEYMDGDIGKATFLLKQLLEMHIESMGISATSLQLEKDAIVFVFDASDAELHIREIVNGIIMHLSNESEYAFFTIAVSGIRSGVENIKTAYEGLKELSEYSRPVAENQVLYEDEVGKNGSRFYFSVEEMEKLTAMLRNASEDEVVHAVSEILEFNIKKDINRFEFSLLCTEIINCGIKLLNRVFHTIPQGLDISAVYKQIEKAYTLDEYRKICVGFLLETISYIKQNKREEDYIISYILDYVENHYAEDIYLNLFAEKLKLTGAYISSYFKEKMNVNLSDYVNGYRIKKAVELTKNPQNKNKDIAVMVGLPNINTFIRLFKKYTGYTPGEYRKNHLGGE